MGSAGIAQPAGTRPSMARACGSPCDAGHIRVLASQRLSLLLRALLGSAAKAAQFLGAIQGPAGYGWLEAGAPRG